MQQRRSEEIKRVSSKNKRRGQGIVGRGRSTFRLVEVIKQYTVQSEKFK